MSALRNRERELLLHYNFEEFLCNRPNRCRLVNFDFVRFDLFAYSFYPPLGVSFALATVSL